MTKRRKFGVLTLADARDRRAWSGTDYFISDALQRNCGDVVYLGPLDTRWSVVGRLLNSLSVRLLGKQYDYKRAAWYSRKISEIAQKRIDAQHLDCIVVPAAATALAYLKPSAIPVVYISDTTFALIINYYSSFTNFLQTSIRDGHQLAQLAMERADIVSFPSKWAASSATSDYGIAPDKVHVVPFGANLDKIPTAESSLRRQRSKKCRLLFLGVDWERKGGDIAVEAVVALEEQHGIKANLTVCGCEIPKGVTHERLTITGFLDKTDPLQARQLERLFEEADYLLVPTRSECYGMIFCEASAYGVPSISTDTGGVSGAISEGRNGYLLPEAARGEEYAEIIAGIEANDDRYKALRQSSRDEYETRVNWDAWARQVETLVDELKR